MELSAEPGELIAAKLPAEPAELVLRSCSAKSTVGSRWRGAGAGTLWLWAGIVTNNGPEILAGRPALYGDARSSASARR